MNKKRLERIRARAKGSPTPSTRTIYKDASDLYPDLVSQIPIFLNTRDGSIPGNNALYNRNLLTWRDNTWVMRAVNILGNSIAPLPLSVVEVDGRDAKPLPNHSLSQLFKAPNPAMPASTFWSWWMVDMMLGGEEGTELVRNKSNTEFVEMWPRQPIDFTVKAQEGRRKYLAVDYYTMFPGTSGEYKLDTSDFIHSKFYNPFEPYRGISAMTAIRMGVMIDQLSQAWALGFFKNNARPDMAIIAPEGMAPTEKRQLVKDLRDQTSGDNAHSAIVLEQKVQDIKIFDARTPDEDWLKQREFSRDEVGAIFGVPDELMGFGKNTYENFDQAQRALYTITLVPLLGMRDDTLTHHFTKVVPVLKPGQEIRTDLTQVPELQEDLSMLITQAEGLYKIGYGVNDINQRLGLSMPEVPWGDTGFINFSMVPISMATGEPDDESDDKNTSTPATTKMHEFGGAAHTALWRAKQARLDRPVKQMQRQLKKWLQGQQNRISQAMRQAEQSDFGQGSRKGKNLNAWLEKGPDDLPALSQIYNYSEEVARFEAEFFELFLKTFSKVALTEFEALPTDITGSVLQIDNPETKAAIKTILNKQAINTQNATWRELTALFAAAEEAGDNIRDIQESLSLFYAGKKSTWQTERIARTAMVAIDNSASQEAWKQSGVVEGNIWISALLPNRTRATHADAHMQERPLGSPFLVGGEDLEYPGDPNGSPENIINCLCSMIPKVMETE